MPGAGVPRVRGAGYVDSDRDPAELWDTEVGTPVDGGWPVLEVDTSGEVDVAVLAARVVAAGLPARLEREGLRRDHTDDARP